MGSLHIADFLKKMKHKTKKTDLAFRNFLLNDSTYMQLLTTLDTEKNTFFSNLVESGSISV